MPISRVDFAEVLRSLPLDITPDAVKTAVEHFEAGTPLDKLWKTVNRPLVGSEDALIPAARHTHGADEGFIRKGVEDLGASLTSPLNIASIGTGVGASLAGKAGKLGISNAARLAEGALQLPMAAEGISNVVNGDNNGARIGGALEAGLALHGVNAAEKHAFDPKAVKSTYMQEHGLAPRTPEPFSLENAKRTADDYVAMKHEPNTPAVQASYDALKTQIDDQHKFLAERAGVKLEPWVGEGEPYPGGAKEMQADVTKNNHLFYLPTNKSEIVGDHPMVEGDANDKFRAVHDYMGHATDSKPSFGPKGEQAAFNSHLETLTPDAHGALATETKGQNSFVNAGPHLRNAAGEIPTKGQPGFVPPSARPFAEQKAGLLPEFHPDRVGTALTGDELALKGTIAPDANGHRPPIEVGQSLTPSQIQLSPELLADVNSRHLANGGSTTDLKTGKGLSAKDARFMLSPYEDRQAILDHPPTEQDLRNFTSRNEDLLSQPGHNLGTWDNQGKHYLDVSIGENDPQKALSLASKHKQLAIFDLLEGKDIQVPKAAAVPPALQIRLDAVVKRGGPVRVNVRKLIAASVKDPQERKSIEDSYLHHLVSSR